MFTMMWMLPHSSGDCPICPNSPNIQLYQWFWQSRQILCWMKTPQHWRISRIWHFLVISLDWCHSLSLCLYVKRFSSGIADYILVLREECIAGGGDLWVCCIVYFLKDQPTEVCPALFLIPIMRLEHVCLFPAMYDIYSPRKSIRTNVCL